MERAPQRPLTQGDVATRQQLVDGGISASVISPSGRSRPSRVMTRSIAEA
jgi:hypothetical protein